MKKRYLIPMFITALTLLTGVAHAAEDSELLKVAKIEQGKYAVLGIGLFFGLAALGGALAQGNAAKSALDGIARNPAAADKLFTPMLLGLAFIESIVIFSWVLALFIKP